MAAGGIAGARGAARWLTHVPDRHLEGAVRLVLLGIGVLLMVESALPREPAGVPLGAGGRGALAVLAGAAIGVVKTAGTTSLLVSIPTILAGLWRPGERLSLRGGGEVAALVVPMSGGSVVGALLGAALVGLVSGAVVKVLLGAILIVSALGVFRVTRQTARPPSPR
jgi:uncharacterized membrane protein YfcA